MAAPITHIVLAINFLSLVPDKFDKKEFVLGTSFPDIRYLNVITRDKTHFKDPTLEKILKEKDSFKAGMMFHNYVDVVREDFMIKVGVYDLMPKSRFSSHALKFNEDVILYDQIDNWKDVAEFFNDVLPQQRKFKIKDYYLACWNKSIARYIQDAPTGNSRFKMLKRCAKKRFRITNSYWSSIQRAVLYKVNKVLYDKLDNLIDQISKDKINQIVLDFYKYFNNLIRL